MNSSLLYIGMLILIPVILAVSGSALTVPTRPGHQTNVCEIFRQQPKWYDYARKSEARWGTPIATQMAFVQQESSFRARVRPPRTFLLGFIPWRRASTAYGYPQALDPTWAEYLYDAGKLFARRSHMKHATDFIGWYNYRVHSRLGIGLHEAEKLYLAYHEGPTGYRRGLYRNKPEVQIIAQRVSARSASYALQLAGCEREFRCRRFYQIGPFCKSAWRRA